MNNTVIYATRYNNKALYHVSRQLGSHTVFYFKENKTYLFRYFSFAMQSYWENSVLLN